MDFVVHAVRQVESKPTPFTRRSGASCRYTGVMGAGRCTTCTGKDGTKLSMEITTTSGNKLRELAEQVIQAQLQAVGVELVINNVSSSTL